MVRIGIVGSDNSHAIAFSKLVNLGPGEQALHVEGAKVTHLFGLDAARNKEVADQGRIPTIVADPREMLGQVDAVLVVFRHGGLHAKYALPFIKAGVPTFVDKPLAVSVADARKLVRAAAKTPITSFSTVRFSEEAQAFIKSLEPVRPLSGGTVFGPADAASEYGGLIFYGIHTVELMLEVFGYDVKTVRAVRTGQGVTAVCEYRDGALVTLQFVTKGARGFGVLLSTQKGHLFKAMESDTAYRDGFRLFLRMFETGERPLTDGQLVRPVEVMEAVVKAYETNTVVRLRPMK